MRLIQSYSRSCSVDIKNKPFILQKYFALPDNIKKYITIQNSSGMGAKDYDLYQEVIDLIYPLLQKEKITIIQLGAKDSKPLRGVFSLLGQTNLGQSAFILNNSLLHLTNDSWSSHYAGAIDVPLITLFGSTTIKNHSPYHFNKDKTIFLESHRNGNRATFAREENPKTINLICPSKVASSVCKLLNLPFSYPYSTIYSGINYQNKLIESVCDSIVDVKSMGIQALIMRMDINFNLDILARQLTFCPCQIITNKEIPLNFLNQYRAGITDIIYKIDKNHNPKFVKSLIENKIKFQLISELNSEELNNIKLDYIDLGLIFPISQNKPKELENNDLNNIYLKSSKILLGRGNCYQTYYDYLINRPFNPNDIKPEPIIDNNYLFELWKEKDFCLFLKKDNS